MGNIHKELIMRLIFFYTLGTTENTTQKGKKYFYIKNMRQPLALYFAVALVLVLAFSGCDKKTSVPTGPTDSADTTATADTTAPSDNTAPADTTRYLRQTEEVLQANPISPLEVELINLDSTSSITVYREFLALSPMGRECVGAIGPGERLVDHVPYGGSTYDYSTTEFGGIAFDVSNSSPSTYGCSAKGRDSTLSVTTPLTEDMRMRGPFYEWDDMLTQELEEWHPEGLSEETYAIKEGSTVYTRWLHGTKITMAVDPEVASKATKAQMDTCFAFYCLVFHRCWRVFLGFAVDERKFVIRDEEGLKYRGEDIIGNVYEEQMFFNEVDWSHPSGRLSHEIGHAWIGGLVAYQPETQNDWWIHEGFDRYLESVVMPDPVAALTGRLTDGSYNRHKDEPLYEMCPKYFGTSEGCCYYEKGALFLYHISRRLKDECGLSTEDFFRYLYDTYFLSINYLGDPVWHHTLRWNTEILQSELENFSELDFSEEFNDYVYGTEVLPVDEIDEQYLIEWDY
jgi:hypothetical protein